VSDLPDDTRWIDPTERAALHMVDALHDTSAIDDSWWQEVTFHFTDMQLPDLMLLAGWYHAISFVARGASVPLEAGAPHFMDYV
jgi:hypothetical protein